MNSQILCDKLLKNPEPIRELFTQLMTKDISHIVLALNLDWLDFEMQSNERKHKTLQILH